MRQIGVGVITTLSRPLHPNLLNLLSQSATIHIEADTQRRGPAFARNQCIKHLYDVGVQHFFLFDDDVHPIQYGWEDYVIESCREAGVDVASYPHPAAATLAEEVGEMQFWQYNTGCFKYLTRHAVETVGYFNEAYETYGYEDIGYLYRARKAGLTARPAYDAAPTRIAEYIKSMDIYGSQDPDYLPYANMSREEKQACINKNEPYFRAETSIHDVFIPYKETV